MTRLSPFLQRAVNRSLALGGLQTLDAFIAENVGKTFSHNAYVREPGFKSLYVRVGPRYIEGVLVPGVVDIPNVVAKKPGAGAFSRLSEKLHALGLPVYVENVQNPRFADKLLRMGYRQVPPPWYQGGPPSFYLLP